MSTDDSPDDLLDALVDAWQEALDAGRDVPPAELAAARPDLLPALEEKVARLRRVAALAAGSLAEQPTARPSNATAAVSAPPVVAGHTVVRELGRGGMGVVYLARQPGLLREVALKVVLSGAFATPREQARLRAEAEAVALLSHPNIVQVFQVGEENGQPFLSLEYCPGGPLSAHTGTPWPPAAAARVTEVLARAVHAAHKARVVHRDLKPSNILLSATLILAEVADAPDPPPVKIADFGLAKNLDGAGDTPTGAAMGTPAYMAPEQAKGHTRAVGPAADIWALGVILYELLTGRPPFLGESAVSTMHLVMHADPVPPTRLVQKVSRDLEAVCLTCLEKEPGRRYASAEELADDLRRWREGHPTRVRPLGPVGRSGRWVRRNPGRAGASVAVVAAVLLAAGAGVGWWADRVRADAELSKMEADNQRLAVEAKLQQQLTEAERFHTGRMRIREQRAGGKPGWPRQNLDELARLAATPSVTAGPYYPELRSEAAAAIAGVDLRRVKTVAAGERWYDAAYSADGKTLAVGSWGAGPIHARVTVRLLDAATGAELRTLEAFVSLLDAAKRGPDGCRRLAFSPDGRWLAAGLRSGQLVRWDLASAATRGEVWAGDTTDGKNGIDRLAFTADSRTLVSASVGEVHTWDAAGGWRQLAAVVRPKTTNLAEADVYDPIGIPACVGNTNVPWRVGLVAPRTGEAMWADDHPPTQLSVSPAGTTLFLTNVGDLGSGFRSTRQYAGNRLAPGPDNRVAGPRGFDGMRFTPDGALVVTSEGPNRRVTLWDVAGARLVCELTMPDAQASYRARPAPDGRTVAVCEADGVGLYEIMGLARRSVGIAPDGAVESMAVSPDGIVMDVVAWEGGVLPVHAYHWRLPERPSPLPGDAVPFPDDTPPCHSDLNIHGERAVSISGRVSRLDHQVFGSMPCEPVGGLRFAQNGDIWVTTGHVVRSFNIHDKKSRLIVANDFTAANRGSVFTALAVGGRVAVAGRRDGTLFRVITAGGDPAREKLSDAAVTALALSKDERTVAAGSAAGEVRILADGAPPVVVTGAHGHEVTTAAFGPGYLATGSEDGTVRLWLPSGQLILTLRFGGGVRKVMLPAQGRFLYVHVNGERGVRRWDMAELHRGLAATGLDPGFPSPGG